MSVTFTTVPSKRLSESITGASATFKINNILSWSGSNLTSADFGTKLYAVFRNSIGTTMELMEIDPATITAASASITILKRGLKFNGDQTTEVSANKLIWVKGDTIVEIGADAPQLLEETVRKSGDVTIEGVKTFSSLPVTTAGNPLAANDLARKAYVDSVVAGIATSVSLLVPGTAGETLVDGNLVYLKTSDNRWWKTDADTAATVENVLLGIAQGAGTAGVAVTNGIMLRGVDDAQSGRVAGEVQYASNTAGAIANTVGTVEVTVGVAKSATELYFDPRFNQQLTEDQQDALAGTSGTPSGTNKFVTADDVSASATADKIVRRDASGLIAGAVVAKFGGTGADGALALTSGATNIDLGSAAVVTKNYTSISITGSGSLTFTNPHANGTIIILKSQGAVTLTSSAAPMIDASGMGANSATQSTSIFANINQGAGGTVQSGGAGTAAGGVGGTGNGSFAATYDRAQYSQMIRISSGAGGGVGGTGAVAAGAAGRGGGALLIECSGAFNFTTASGISVNGKVGATGTSGGANAGGPGGSGGGAGGVFIALYGSLTANSGTISISGGNGGDGGGGNGGTGGGAGGVGGTGVAGSSTGGTGGIGQGWTGVGTAGGGGGGGGASDIAGGNGSNGSDGSGSSRGGGGGGGAAGYSLVQANITFN